jgi:polar amino acid transport system permease protein
MATVTQGGPTESDDKSSSLGPSQPTRGFHVLRRDLRPLPTVAGLLGAVALFMVVVGTVTIVWAGGVQRPEQISHTLKSSGLSVLLVVGAALGALAAIVAMLTYRHADTILARSIAVGGLVLGLQALLLGAVLRLFVSGDTATFAANFLAFHFVTPHLHEFLRGAWNTVVLALAAGFCGMLLGLAISTLAISRRRLVRAPARIYVNIIRGTPILVQISLIYFGIALGLKIEMSTAWAIIIALAINSAAYYAEIFRSGLQSIERGQLEASRGLGLSHFKTVRLVIVPQAIRRVIPPLLNEFIAIVKDTSLIGFLGVTLSQRELFSVGQQGYAQSFNATFYVFSALGYLVITIPLIVLVNFIERRLRSGLVMVA